MHFEEHLIYHIYNQGNNREPIFFQPRNYLFFLEKVKIHLLPHLDILCYCLMPNHFHFLGKVKKLEIGLNNGKSRKLNDNIAIMLRSYTRAINKQENRSGSLFREGTKAKNGIIEDIITIDGSHRDLFFKPNNNYAANCFHYIHKNPVETNLVLKPEDWPYSSARDYGENGKHSICNMELAKALGLVG